MIIYPTNDEANDLLTELVGDELGMVLAGHAIRAALSEQVPGRLLVAVVDDAFGGASFVIDRTDETPQHLYLAYIGSVVPGAGDELLTACATLATERGLPLLGRPLEDTHDHWSRVGWRPDPLNVGSPLWGWTTDETARRAEQR